MNDPYSVLGVSREATDEQVKTAYRELVRKYHPDQYADDNPLKDLAQEKMQQVNAAYEQIEKERAARPNAENGASQDSRNDSFGAGGVGVYAQIRRAINGKRFAEAQRKLDEIAPADRSADWHYLTSILLVRRGRMNDAMRELETACNMDPTNTEYQHAKEMFNQNANGYGSTYWGAAGTQNRRSSSSDACNLCANLICLDCLCEMCGGDLIPCI